MSEKTVFISYSHDSPEHSERVLQLSNTLRSHGVDVELDQYHVRPPHGWPRWCEEQLRPENAAFVLVVCTDTYRQRVEGRTAADEGRGVFWEGGIIASYLYNEKGNERFIPILLPGTKEDDIPRPLSDHARYALAAFDLKDPGYRALYRELTGQPAVTKPVVGEIVPLSSDAESAVKPLSPLPAREVRTSFANVKRAFIGPWQMLLLFFGCAAMGIGSHSISVAVSHVLISVAAAVGVFGFLDSVAHVKSRWGSFGGGAAVMITTLALLFHFDPPQPPDSDVFGNVYLDGRPASAGTITLLEPVQTAAVTFGVSDGGGFRFRSVRGIGHQVRFSVAVTSPVDLPPQVMDSRFEAGKPIRIELTAPPEPVPPKPAPLPPNLNRAKEPMGEKFIGRVNELRELDDAWRSVVSPGGTAPMRTVGVIAWGGFGKTTLVRQWLWLRMEKDKWPDGQAPEAVFWFGFGAESGADTFLAEAIAYFGGAAPDLVSLPTDGLKVEALKKAIGQRRFVLVLDGLEAQQIDRHGDSFGQCAGFLQMLLREHAAGRLGQGLCLVTSRLPLTDLASSPAYRSIDLESRKLSDPEVRLYLERGGVEKCSEQELQELIEVTGRHPLALATLAAFLKEHNQGRAAGWQQFKGEALVPQPGKEDERHLWRVLSWYDRKLSPPETEVMTAIAHFREPVQSDWLRRLLVGGDAPSAGPLASSPATATGSAPSYSSAELAMPAPRLTAPQLHQALARLVSLKLINQEKAVYSAHNLIREHFRQRAAALDSTGPVALHTRIYRLYTSVVQPEFQPDTLEELLPLYEAVYHGCKAGLQQKACDDVYFARINRGQEFYSTRKLGALGSDLGAVACFFENPWNRVSPALTEADQAWLLNEAATRLRALGRLEEALDPMRAGLEMRIKQEVWKSAAIVASNLSELELTLGEVAGAVGDAEQSVTYADRSGDAFQRMGKRTTHADALHQAGRRAEAEARFREAEQMQAESEPTYPLLYSVRGFQYCDLLLTEAERAAWHSSASVPLAGSPGVRLGETGDRLSPAPATRTVALQSCRAVSERAAQTLKWVTESKLGLVTIALNHLSLGRAALYAVILDSSHSDFRVPRSELDAAVTGLRRSGGQDVLPHALLTRAWLRSLTGPRTGPDSAQSDLDEAWEIAERGPMPLFLADIHVYRARLFGRSGGVSSQQSSVISREKYPWNQNPDGTPRGPADDLAAARRLIEKHGYGRRKGELEDAEAALKAP
jgi:tetratricopeptide (TPR) repeat protein